MTIILTQSVRIAGTTQPIGTQLTLEGGAEGDLVHRGCATYVTDPHSGEGDMTVRANINTVTGGITYSAAGVEMKAYGFPGPSVAVFGDSITNGGFTNTATLNYMNAIGYPTWVRVLSNQRVNIPHSLNFGVNGDTTALALARVATVVAAAPDYCVVLVGTNDVSSSVAYATVIANLSAIYTALLNSGIKVIAVPILPRSYWAAGGSLPTAQRRQIQRINTWIRSTATSTAGIYLADPTLNMSTISSGDPIGGGVVGTPPASSGYTYDGLHPSQRGAYWIGKAIADVFSLLIPPRNTSCVSINDTYNATDNPTGDLLPNTMFGTASGGSAGTGASGTIVSGLTVGRQSGSTLAATCSVDTVSTANGQTYNRQVIACAAPAGGATEVMRAYYQVSATAHRGESVYAEVDLDVFGITGVNAIKSIYLQCDDETITARDGQEQSGFLHPDVVYSGVLKTQPFVVSAGATVINVLVRVTLDGTVASNGVTVALSRLALRRV